MKDAREEGLTSQDKKLCVYSKSHGAVEGLEAKRRLDQTWA